MNILVVDNGSRHTGELVASLGGHVVRRVRYRRHTRLDREWADLYLLTGSNVPAFLRGYYRREFDLIRTSHKPIIGICLGFELIALAHGERLVKDRIRTTGINDIYLTPELLGSEYRTRYSVYEAHRWSLRAAGTLEVIGTSKRGIEAVRHPTRKVFGFQFHPEVREPANDGFLLLERVIRYIRA